MWHCSPFPIQARLPCSHTPPPCLPKLAVDSVEEDHNGDILLLRYLLGLLQQDLRARLQASGRRRARGGAMRRVW